MSQIFDQTFKRTLDVLLANAAPGQSFEAWTFDDAKSRREAEERLKKKASVPASAAPTSRFSSPFWKRSILVASMPSRCITRCTPMHPPIVSGWRPIRWRH